MRYVWMIAAALSTGCAESEPNSLQSQNTVSSGEAGAPTELPPGSGKVMAGQWFEKRGPEGSWAGYGPPYSEAAFSVRCEREKLIFSTTEMPPSGPGATKMHLTAEGLEREIPAAASEEGLPNTEAAVDASDEWLSELESASGSLSVRVGASDPLTVPISKPLTSLISDCRR